MIPNINSLPSPKPFPSKSLDSSKQSISLSFPAHFDFSNAHEKIYTKELSSGKFKPKSDKNNLELSGNSIGSHKDSSFFIPMPPPNITGQLHLGHALFLTLQDSLTRWHRLKGDNTLWLPGTDHAGLATHEKILEELGTSSYSKEEYLNMGAQIKSKNESRIKEQIEKMGASCDWSRYTFTLDDKIKASTLAALEMCQQSNMLYRQGEQWYLDMSTQAKELINAIESNDIEIIPATEKGQLLNFLYKIQPWCISRQIAWGHSLPIYQDKTNLDAWCTAATLELAIEKMPHSLEENIEQIPGTFDTWFSSSLWPFATLGWPEKTKDYNDFYPAQLIETADDILFPWCAKMLMMGKLCTGIWPFKQIYLHGIIRDSKGRKMSKSLGNGIDPLTIIDKHGLDPLRWCMLTHTIAGQDMKISEQDFSASSKWCNKIWQAGRFFHKAFESLELTKEKSFNTQQLTNGYLKDYFKTMSNKFENYEFMHLTTELQHLFKHDFCDNWIEQHKAAIHNKERKTILEGLEIYASFLILFYPFMPYLTQSLWDYFYDCEMELPLKL